jgi:periplasmic protein TonB
MKMMLAVALFVAAAYPQTPPAVYTPGNGVTLPRVVEEVKADYTNEAKAQRIEGAVLLEAVVLADGSVGEVKVKQSLDSVYGLDANAVKAMKQWEFTPGTKDGNPVAVVINVETTFSL